MIGMVEIGPIWTDDGVGSTASIVLWTLIAFSIVAIIIFAVRILRARTNRSWQEAAIQLGLNFTPQQLFWKPYVMSGTLEGGYYCRVHTFSERMTGFHSQVGSDNGPTSETFTQLEVRFPQPLNIGLSLRPATFIGGMAAFLGIEDMEVGGDPDFDKAFTVEGTDEREIKKFLTAERKEKIMAAYQSLHMFEIDDVSISIKSGDVMRDKETIVHIVMELKNLVAALSTTKQTKSIFD